MDISLDQTRFSLASMTLDAAGITIIGCQDLSCKEQLETEPMYGNGSIVIGRTIGKLSGTGSLTMLPEEADSLVQQLGPGFGTVYWQLGATFLEVQGSGIYAVSASRVRISSKELKPGEPGGSKGSTIPFELTIDDPINWNGVTIIQLLTQGVISFSAFGLNVSI